jgi:muramidase (phage lysozyme)
VAATLPLLSQTAASVTPPSDKPALLSPTATDAVVIEWLRLLIAALALIESGKIAEYLDMIWMIFTQSDFQDPARADVE